MQKNQSVLQEKSMATNQISLAQGKEPDFYKSDFFLFGEGGFTINVRESLHITVHGYCIYQIQI